MGNFSTSLQLLSIFAITPVVMLRNKICYLILIIYFVLNSHSVLTQSISYIVASGAEHNVFYTYPNSYRYLDWESRTRVEKAYKYVTGKNPEFLVLTGGLSYNAQIPELKFSIYFPIYLLHTVWV